MLTVFVFLFKKNELLFDPWRWVRSHISRDQLAHDSMSLWALPSW